MTIRGAVFVILVVGTAIVAPLPYGSINPKPMVACLAALALAQFFAPRRVTEWRHCVALLPPIALFSIYCVIAWLQSVPGLLVGADLWPTTAALLRTGEIASLSVDPDRTRFAIGSALMMALALMGGFGLSQMRGGTRRLLDAVAIGGVLYAILGIGFHLTAPNYVLFTPKFTHFGNLTGTFLNRNTEAAFLGILLVVHIARLGAWLRAELPFRRDLISEALRLNVDHGLLWRLIVMLPIVTALLMTGSRAGILIGFASAAVAGAAIAVNLPARGRRRSRRLAKRVAAVVFPLALILAIGGAGLDARIRDEGLTDEARALTYASSFDLIADRPWFGHGIGTFELVFPARRRVEASVLGIWNKAHSTLLEIAVETGLPFALTVLLCSIATFVRLLKSALIQPEREILLAGVVVFAQIGLHSLVDYPLQIPGLGVLILTVIGTALGHSVRGLSAGGNARSVSKIQSQIEYLGDVLSLLRIK